MTNVLNKMLLVSGIVGIFSLNLNAQERFGICNSMYAGISGNWINPSSLAASPYRWDLNIVAGHFYLDNNYVYLDKTNFSDQFSHAMDGIKNGFNDSTIVYNIDNVWERSKGENATYWLKSRDNSFNKNMYLSMLFQGPSLMFNVKKWTFAITTAGRAAVSLVGLNKDGAKLLYEGLSYEPMQNKNIDFKRVRINSMEWAEYGVSAAKVVKKVNDNLIKVGATLKFLNAFSGSYYNFKSMTLNALNDSVLSIKGLYLKNGYAPDQEAAKTYADSGGINLDNISSVGKGISTDIGFTIEKKKLTKEYQCPSFCNKALELQYAWKLGVSLIDIGFVNINKNARRFNFVNKSDIWINIDKTQIKDISGIDTSLINHFNDSIFDIDKTRFTMLTPWAISVQYDYNIGYNFYVNATWVQRLPHFGIPGVDRANVIAITPKYEIRWVGVVMPIVFYQYLWPRIGFAVRLNNYLVVGTDKIGAFFGNKLSGADAYFALKFNILRKCPKESKSMLNTN